MDEGGKETASSRIGGLQVLITLENFPPVIRELMEYEKGPSVEVFILEKGTRKGK